VQVVGSSGNDTIVVRKYKQRLYISANGAPMQFGNRCVVSGSEIQCNGSPLVIQGLGGNDRLTVNGTVRSTLDGGTGNDWLVGGSSGDVFIGGDGFDTVDYSARIGQTITATPGTGSDDGRRREGDDIRGDVEQVILP
jgi:Ca2+-binding RTX toxin-like protein